MMKDRGTVIVSWLALVVALITFLVVVLSDTEREANRRSYDAEYLKQVRRIADAMEAWNGKR